MVYKFSDLFRWCSGKSITATYGDIPIYGSNGIIGYTDIAKYSNKIILGRVGAYCGSVEYCKDDFNATDNTLITTCDESKITYKFAYYLLSQYKLNDYAGGSAQPLITQSILKHLKCSIPSLSHQQKIASILSAYDNLIENNNKRIKILEQMAENLYKEWFVRFRFPGYQSTEFENGLPKGWKVVQAQDLFDISIGRTPDRKVFEYFTDNSSDYLWVSIADMKDKMFVMSSSEYLTNEAIQKVNMPMVSENTVILSFKLSVGRVSITTQLTCTNEAIAHFNTNDRQLLEYTYLYLKFFQYQDLGNTSAIGNAVNSTIIRKMKFLYPDKKILNVFHQRAKLLFDEIKLLSYKNQNLTKQRDLLLPRLMSGKLIV